MEKFFEDRLRFMKQKLSLYEKLFNSLGYHITFNEDKLIIRDNRTNDNMMIKFIDESICICNDKAFLSFSMNEDQIDGKYYISRIYKSEFNYDFDSKQFKDFKPIMELTTTKNEKHNYSVFKDYITGVVYEFEQDGYIFVDMDNNDLTNRAIIKLDNTGNDTTYDYDPNGDNNLVNKDNLSTFRNCLNELTNRFPNVLEYFLTTYPLVNQSFSKVNSDDFLNTNHI